jgi:hypothetical protein
VCYFYFIYIIFVNLMLKLTKYKISYKNTKIMSKIKFICFIFIFSYFKLFSQDVDNQKLIKNVVNQFFEGMKKGDSTLAKKAFYKEASLTTVTNKKDGSLSVQKENIVELFNAIGTPHKEIWDERLLTWDIRIDEPLANVICDYAFYVDEKFSHSGVDIFQMVKTNDGWKILSIADTRHKNKPEIANTATIDTVMNRWHKAAATADEDVFFGLMTENADYIGTDPSEHWKRDELRKWSAKFFERDSAWDFKPKKRTVYFTPNGKYAWFDELLDTWMGDCRGSGVLVKTPEGWKIEQYVLSMAVLNDLTNDYIKQLKAFQKKKNKFYFIIKN